jgi:hypothetical protein
MQKNQIEISRNKKARKRNNRKWNNGKINAEKKPGNFIPD